MTYPLLPINTVLLPEFQPYSDQYGLITDSAQGDPSGNGILFTGHYVVGLVEKNLINDQEKERILEVFESCQRLPGLFMRNPVGQTNYEAHDDLIGILGSEAKMIPNKKDRKLSQSIYNYGISVNADQLDQTEQDPSKQTQNQWVLRLLNLFPGRNRWVFNTKNPSTFHVNAWLGLRREVIATMAMGSGNEVSLFDWLYWATSMMLLKDTSDNNAYILAMHSCWACEGYGLMTDWIVRHVQAKMKEKYGDFGKLLGTYYQDPNHPLIKLLDGVVV